MAAARTLSHREAQRFYDRFGARQDSQAFYERLALDRLLPQLELGEARALLEFGCGTGRLAEELLAERLSPGCRYLGIDSSRTMVELARARLARFGARAEVRHSDGSPRVAEPDGSFDRFVTCYVLDLLSEDDIRTLLAEAERLLAPGALLGVVGLTHGETPLARAVGFVWEHTHRLRPALVGGCRPLEIAPFLRERAFRLRQRSVVAPYGIASEVVVAERV